MTKKANSINNPLKIAVDGSKAIFQKAPMAAIVLAFLSAASATNLFDDSQMENSKGAATTPDMALQLGEMVILGVIIAVILFGIIVIGSIIAGIFAYTAAEVAHGREVTFRQAINTTMDRLWSFVGLQLLIIGKVILWSLLFIIPGIIMAVRYSLASLSFFDSNKKLSGNAAIKDSLALTKGAWLTTFSAQMLLNIITLGMISPIVDTGSKAMLYRQFNALHSEPKPKAHMLSWVTLGLTILIAIIGISVASYISVKHGVSAL